MLLAHNVGNHDGVPDEGRRETVYYRLHASVHRDRWRAMKGDPVALLTTARAKLGAADWTSPESLKELVLAAGEEHSLKLGKAQALVRVAVMGCTVGIPLFESLEVLGKDRILARVDAAVEKLAG